jgi:8-oxo-dGTP pyrophosphatase MutT (NUDIX family)
MSDGNMNSGGEMNSLIWKEEAHRTVLRTPIFSVGESDCRSSYGKLKTFNVIDARDWAMVVPVIYVAGVRCFVMVWQWRHGARELSLEFPGGVIDAGEEPVEAAVRELFEETGYAARKIEALKSFSPNPAIMANNIHYFLAHDLASPVDQALDPDELVDVEIVPCSEVLDGLGESPYISALVGTATLLYVQRYGL